MTLDLPGILPLAPARDADDHDRDGDEWYTPPSIAAALAQVGDRLALAGLIAEGGIDCDPCAAEGSPVAARHRIDVRAGGDGLAGPWPGDGLAFSNPPYSREVVGAWIRACRVESARRPVIGLLPGRVETAVWHREIWRRGVSVVIPRGRLRFVPPSGARAGCGKFASVFVCWWGDGQERSAHLARVLLSALASHGVVAVAR